MIYLEMFIYFKFCKILKPVNKKYAYQIKFPNSKILVMGLVIFTLVWDKNKITPTILLDSRGLYLERAKRFELSTSTLARSHSTAELYPHMVPWGGIEPPTRGFSVLCSTD